MARLLRRWMLSVEVAEVPFVGAVPGRPVGWLPQLDGLVSLGAGVRFGQLSSQLARMIAVTGARTTVTPVAFDCAA